jgi:hypothetical protein
VTDPSPQQPEPDEPADGGLRAPRGGDEPGRGPAAKTPPRWSDQQPAPAPWYVGRPGPAPQPPGWGTVPPRQPAAPPLPGAPAPGTAHGPGPQGPQGPGPQGPQPQDRPPENQAPGSAAPNGGGQVPRHDAPPPAVPPPAAPPPYGQPPQGPQPWHDPNRYGQPQRPPQNPHDPWAQQQRRRPEPQAEPEKRGPLDLRTRWARGLSYGAVLCTLGAIWYSISNFPTWLVGAGAGLALGLAGLWLGVFSHRAAAARGKRAPQAVSAIVWGSIASLISLMIIAFSLLFYSQLSQLSNCMRSANTVAAQKQCQTTFEDRFGGARR